MSSLADDAMQDWLDDWTDELDAAMDELIGRSTDACPECGTGHVEHLSDNPTAIRYRCSNNCGWDA